MTKNYVSFLYLKEKVIQMMKSNFMRFIAVSILAMMTFACEKDEKPKTI